MELSSSIATKFELPESIIKEFHAKALEKNFEPTMPELHTSVGEEPVSLFSLNLNLVLEWLHSHELPKPLEKEVCSIPVLLFVPDFSTQQLLFHYDGTPQSAELIRKFLKLFGNLIKSSKATIISPSFIPKSKIKDEQDLIQQVSQATSETSFIKLNFLRIGDFWSYAVKHECTLLVTTKNYQSDLTKVLFHFYKEKIWSDRLSFYLSV